MVAIDADGREIADPAQIRRIAARSLPRSSRAPDRRHPPAQSRRSRCVACLSRSGSLAAKARCPSKTKGSMPTRCSASNFSGERVVPAIAIDGSGRAAAKAFAGIAGAEDEEARGHAVRRSPSPECCRRMLRPSWRAIRVSDGSIRVVAALHRERLQTSARGISRDSAQTAAPRTSGEASASSASAVRDQRRVAGIAGGDQHVAQEPVAADALDRRAGEQ